MTRARDLADFNFDGKAVTINESSADLDFRVETDNDDTAFFIQGNTGDIGISTNSPSTFSAGNGMPTIAIQGNDSTYTDRSGALCFISQDGSTGKTWMYQDTDMYIQSATNTDMYFYTGNTERMKILAGGNVDISAGHILLDNGYGINFAATADGSGMTSELLDDYEEGTFSPTIDSGVSSVTYTYQVGRYTKVGRQVSFMFHIDVNTASASTGQIQFGGLPFTSLNTAHVWGGAFTVYTGGAFQKQNVTWAVQGGTTRVIGYNNNGATFKGTDFDSITGGWYIAGFYIV